MQKLSLALLGMNPPKVFCTPFTQEVEKTAETNETPKQLILEGSIHQ